MREREIAEICRKLSEILQPLEGAKVDIYPAKEHRFVVVFRGKNLADGLSDAYPHREGSPVPPVKALRTGAEKTAQIVRGATFFRAPHVQNVQ